MIEGAAGNFHGILYKIQNDKSGGSRRKNSKRSVRLIPSRGVRTFNIAPGINECTRRATSEGYNRGASRRIATTQFRCANVKVTYGAFRVHWRATRRRGCLYSLREVSPRRERRLILHH